MTDVRVAIVTGGGSGIGLAISERLAADGHALAIFDRDGASALAAAEKMVASGGSAIGLTVDVTDRAQIDLPLDHLGEVESHLGRQPHRDL